MYKIYWEYSSEAQLYLVWLYYLMLFYSFSFVTIAQIVLKTNTKYININYNIASNYNSIFLHIYLQSIFLHE